MNRTMNETSLPSDYDHDGAIIYTIVTLLFYSLSLFCSLILNIDPDDHYYEKKWNVYQNSIREKISHANQTNVLNTLCDRSVRARYWRIYYGDDELQSRTGKFLANELKRVSMLSKRMKELNSEQMKHSNKHEEFNQSNRIVSYTPQHSSPNPSTSSFLSKFRRPRSTSVPGISPSDYARATRSFDVLCETPLCKPPNFTLTEYP